MSHSEFGTKSESENSSSVKIISKFKKPLRNEREKTCQPQTTQNLERKLSK